MTLKPIYFRPNALEDLILEKLAEADLPVKDSKSDLIRFCIRTAGENLIDPEEFKEILLHSARF